jgi:cell pole-organizing protein PopZ
MAQDGEASVEEILESIKKVIARDNRDGAMEARRRRQADADAAEKRAVVEDNDVDIEEVLDLADMELTPDEVEQDAPLVREEAVTAMQDNLAALAMLAEPGARPQIVRSGETSLEGLTRELLRPMLAEWLDKNLPGMVEEMVQAEIARIAGKKR